MLAKIIESTPKMRAGHRAAILFVAGVFVFLRLLITTPVGWLIAAIIVYSLLPHLSPAGLLDWILGQDKETKVAFGTSALTVIGFLVAFSTAHSAWRAQQRALIQLATGNEIYAFFRQVWNDTLTLELFAERLVKTRQIVVSRKLPPADIEFHVSRLLENVRELEALRQRLSRASIEVHGLRAKHEVVLTSIATGPTAMHVAIEALSSIAERMWFPVPSPATDIPTAIAFLTICDPKAWQEFHGQAEKSRGTGEMAVSAINGFFVGHLVRPTIGSWNSLRKQTAEIVRENQKSESPRVR